jgi:hypothetical protein
VPPLQVLAFRQATVGTGLRQPCDFPHAARLESQAFGIQRQPRLVNRAPTGRHIQKRARNRGQGNFTRLGILYLLETTYSATVTNGFPLIRRHLIQRPRSPKRASVLFHRTTTYPSPLRWSPRLKEHYHEMSKAGNLYVIRNWGAAVDQDASAERLPAPGATVEIVARPPLLHSRRLLHWQRRWLPQAIGPRRAQLPRRR